MSDKAFATLSAQFAMLGYSLERTNPADGPVRLFLSHHGLNRQLTSIDEARRIYTAMEKGGQSGSAN